jgi:hypothetical protein
MEQLKLIVNVGDYLNLNIDNMDTNSDPIDVIELLRKLRVEYERLLLENQSLKLKLSNLEVLLESTKQNSY